MSADGWAQIGLPVAVVAGLTSLLGGYMERVFTGRRVLLSPVIGPCERVLYRVMRVDPLTEALGGRLY